MKRILIFLLASALMCTSAYAQSAANGTATAQQGQQQVQGQTANGGGGGSGGSNDFTIANSFNGSAPIRALPFATPVLMSTEGGPGYFAAPNYGNPGPNFMTMKKLVTVLNAVDLSKQELEGKKIKVVVQQLSTPKTDKSGKPKRVMFHLMVGNDPLAMFDKFQPVAIVTMKSDNDKVNSGSLAKRMHMIAQQYGGTDVILMEEGVTKRIESWGAGIGLSYNYASVGSGSSDNGSVGAGGTGVSWGEAEYISLPYLTAIVGKAN